MRTSRALCIVIAAAGMLCAPITSMAQTATTPPHHVPLQKGIGEAEPQVVPSLFVLNSRGATLQGSKLVLTGVSPNSIVRRPPGQVRGS